MPNGKKAKSKKQAAFLGAVASGAAKSEGLSKQEAKDMLSGVKVGKLPAKAKKKK